MQLNEARELIQHATIKSVPGNWVDLGCGSGIFTKALAGLLPPQSNIYAVDKTRQHIIAETGSNTTIIFQQADFTKDFLPFSALDGIMMANSLHYVENKKILLLQLKEMMAVNGSFILIEYNMRKANPWVPFPISFTELKELFLNAGYSNCRYLGERPSAYGNGNLYACQFNNNCF